MELLLHFKEDESELRALFRRAFDTGKEICIASAYLTDWDSTLKLNEDCRYFRFVVGSDFGITRKAACQKVIDWLPSERRAAFRVAKTTQCFHPKALFWKDAKGKCYAVIGSSNLTHAAFTSNIEANTYSEISPGAYKQARKWIADIEDASVVLDENWLKTYVECPRGGGGSRTKVKPSAAEAQVRSVAVPRPKGMTDALRVRRRQIAAFNRARRELDRLFRRCAAGKITSKEFYEALPDHWNGEKGRLQGKGWERKGGASNFTALARSFVRILKANQTTRDAVVADEIDRLAAMKNPARTAFLSEMLCLHFPTEYPILNKPIQKFRIDLDLRMRRGMTQGERYIWFAQHLRRALAEAPKSYPVKNIAELDTVIWMAYGD